MAAPDLHAPPSDAPGLRLLFAAMRPAARLAVAAGVPLDAARDMMIGALMAETQRRRPGLDEMALALGRSTRQVRTLLRTGARDFEARGENLVDRAERLLHTPMTLPELTRQMPRYYAFDAAEEAVISLVRDGRVVAEPQRDGPPIYRTVAAPRPTRAPDDHAERVAHLADHLVGVAGALGEAAAPLTAHAHLRPEDAARLDAEIAAFVADRVPGLTGADPDAPTWTVYAGLSAPEAQPRAHNAEGPALSAPRRPTRRARWGRLRARPASKG